MPPKKLTTKDKIKALERLYLEYKKKTEETKSELKKIQDQLNQQ